MSTEDFDFLVGQTVEQLWIWGPCRLVFLLGDGAEPSMYVDSDAFELTVDGTPTSINAAEDPGGAGVILQLLHQRVDAAAADQGVLRLSFTNGSELSARPDERYESWTVAGNGRVFQCLPGGEVDSW